jgi:glycyl-tRNA synthetase
LGLKKEHLRFRQHEPKERAHYAADSWDIEYDYPDWGFKELEGIANRTDYDLKTHSKYSGKDLRYKDPVTGETYFPYVVEPSVGVSRLLFALLVDAYTEEPACAGREKRVVLKLNPRLAPVKVAVFPLVANKPELVAKAKEVYRTLKSHFVTAWDERGNIGKRYMAQDEVGTPWCVTIDYTSLEDGSVTVRDRDTTKQERVKIDTLPAHFEAKLNQS